MSRSYKFRAWYPGDSQVKPFMEYDFHISSDGHIYDSRWPCDQNYGDELILMQYTGLKDKNGKEIYEGDICKAYKANSYLDGNYAVVWDEKRGRWAYDGRFTYDRMYQVGSSGNLECHVIGNIYENPELIAPQEPTV